MHSIRKEFGGKSGFRPSPIKVLTVLSAEHDSNDPQDRRDLAEKEMFTAALAAAGGSRDSLNSIRHIHSFSRGRLIWRPDRFLSTIGKLHTLSCLHRNVVMSTLHVASLLRAANVLAEIILNSPQAIPPHLDQYARAVAGLIGRIYKGIDTYSLPCLKDQIAPPTVMDVVNRLRNRLDQPALQ